MQSEEQIETFIKTVANEVKQRECSVRFALVRVWMAACTHMAEQYRTRRLAQGCSCGKHN